MIDKTVNANGLDIHYHDYPHDGETIIFLHFGFSSLAMWHGVLPLFENKYRMIVPDCRGHGRSEKPKNGYDIDTMADDVIALMDELNIIKAHLVGSSLGAELSVSIAARFPDMVLSIVVEGSAMNNHYGDYGLKDLSEEEIEKELEMMLGHFAASQEVYDSPEQLLETMKKAYEPKGFWTDSFKAVAEYEIYRTEDGKFTGIPPSWVTIGYMKENFGKLKFENYYKDIKSPVLFLPGEKEWQNERMQNALNYFSSLLPKSEIKHIPGSMHAFVWLLKPIEAGEAVFNFLSKLK